MRARSNAVVKKGIVSQHPCIACGGRGGERKADEWHCTGSNDRWLQQLAKMRQPSSKEMKTDATCLFVVYYINMLFSIRRVAVWNPDMDLYERCIVYRARPCARCAMAPPLPYLRVILIGWQQYVATCYCLGMYIGAGTLKLCLFNTIILSYWPLAEYNLLRWLMSVDDQWCELWCFTDEETTSRR